MPTITSWGPGSIQLPLKPRELAADQRENLRSSSLLLRECVPLANRREALPFDLLPGDLP